MTDWNGIRRRTLVTVAGVIVTFWSRRRTSAVGWLQPGGRGCMVADSAISRERCLFSHPWMGTCCAVHISMKTEGEGGRRTTKSTITAVWWPEFTLASVGDFKTSASESRRKSTVPSSSEVSRTGISILAPDCDFPGRTFRA